MQKKSLMFPEAFSGKLTGWLFFGWIIVLLFPLLNIFPRPSVLFGHPWKVELISSIFLAIISLIVYFDKNKVLRKFDFFSSKYLKAFVICFIFFILWSGFSVVWAKSGQSAIYHTLTWTSYLSFFILCFILIRSSKSLKPLLIPTAIAVNIIALLCVLDLLGMQNYKINIFEFRIRYAKFAELCLVLAPLFCALSLYFKGIKSSIVLFATGFCSWLIVMLSLSNGAFIAGSIGFLLFFALTFIFSKKRFKKKIFIIALIWLFFTMFTQAAISYGSSMPSTTDYISGKVEKPQNTTEMRIFFLKISRQMINDNFIKGVGGNNFGVSINESRKRYVKNNPGDELNKIAEDIMIERSHNEFVQIFAELGFVGVLVFSLAFVCFCLVILQSFIDNKFKFSPLLIACLSGLFAFLVSSLFSSFSFRAIQNGFVFFMILAIAANELYKIGSHSNNERLNSKITLNWQKTFLVFGFLAFCSFAIIAGKKAASDFYIYLAESERNIKIAETYYRQAILLDEENASAYFSGGFRFLTQGQPEKASVYLRKSIDYGAHVTAVYSYLATAQILSNKFEESEITMSEAVSIYPYSTFVRIRYGIILEQNGKLDEAQKQISIAQNVDREQASGWYIFLKYGSAKAAQKAQKHKNHPALMELQPINAMYAIRDEEKLLGNNTEDF